MKSGGHGQSNIELLKKYGIGYNIVKTFPNGVRIGSIDNHKEKFKKTGQGNGQAWFPKSWSAKEIKIERAQLMQRNIKFENVLLHISTV